MADDDRPAWWPWISLIANKLLACPEVRWDRFVEYAGTLIFYGWIDREDDHADFYVITFYLYPGPKIDLSTLSSSADVGEEIDARLRDGTAPPHVDCQRVEEFFGTLADLNVVRLEGES